MALPTPKDTASQPSETPANIDAAPTHEPFDASWFLRDNRIHFEGHSQFLPGNFLMIHPAELKPENQQRTFAKIVKHHSVPDPSSFAFFPRNQVMFALASYLPISKESRLSDLKDQTEKLESFAKEGLHPDGKELIERYLNPLQANVKWRHDAPDIDAADREFLTSSITLYLVINEALNAQGLREEPAHFIANLHSADGVVSELMRFFGLNISEFVEIAQRQGIEGIANRLGVTPAALSEIQQVAQSASENQYSDNTIRNWDIGRHAPGMENRTIEEKMAVGLLQRSGGLLAELAARTPIDGPTPEHLQKDYKRAVAMIREIPLELQKALYYRGVEFGFTSRRHLGPAAPQAYGALGVHVNASYSPGSADGVETIVSSNADNRGFVRRIVQHEANHIFYRDEIGQEGIKTLETMIQSDEKRLQKLRNALDEWYVADATMRPQIEAKIDQVFRIGEMGLAEATYQGGPNAIGLERMLDIVDDALKNLGFDSRDLTLDGYSIPEHRAEEVIPRFAERLHQSLKDSPALLGFMCPQLMVGYHDIYLKSVERHNQKMEQAQQQFPEALRNLGLPLKGGLPKAQADIIPFAAAKTLPKPNAQAPSAQHEQTIAPAAGVNMPIPQGAANYLAKLNHTQVMQQPPSTSISR